MSADTTEIDEMHKWLYELESRRYSLHDIAEKILDRQERRERDLVDELRPYFGHKAFCNLYWNILNKIIGNPIMRKPVCTCGLDGILARLDGKGKVN